ncbi:4166_t:CDS:2 [Scutellospora calospora]|uniref:4166_t:CDS:1 n=1 Tax=Scutellospora calospora TaxID=85575 RepID=A0ACA9JYJ8_9GLOM|nr:4166_t:CDS:2 [Scutellospora calospora]
MGKLDPDSEINEEKESVSTENTETDFTSPEEKKTEAKTIEKEELELINKPMSKLEDSNDSNLSETELTTQTPIEENAERPIPEKRVESINILVFQYQKMTKKRRQKLAFSAQYVEYENTYFIYTHPTLGSHFTMEKLRLREAIYWTNFRGYQLVANNPLDLLTLQK